MSETNNVVIAVIEKSNFSNPDAGYAQPIAKVINNGEIIPFDKNINLDELYPNRGEVRIREGLESTGLGGNYSLILSLELQPDMGYESDNPDHCKWLMVHKGGLSKVRRWSAIEVFESEIPEPEDLENFRITSWHKPTELIFLKDPASSFLLGPFLVWKIEREHDSDERGYGAAYQFGVSPLNNQIPSPYQLLTKASHSALKIPLTASNLDAVTSTIASPRREFVISSMLNPNDFHLVDAATNEQVAKDMGKLVSKLTDDPKQYVEAIRSVQELFTGAKELSDPLLKQRFERVKKLPDLLSQLPQLNPQVSQADWSADTPERRAFVTENLDVLLKQYSRKEFEQERAEADKARSEADRDIKNLRKEKERTLKENQQILVQNEKLRADRKSLEDDAADRKKNIDEEISKAMGGKQNKIDELDKAIESRQAEHAQWITKLDTAKLQVKETENIKKKWQAEIIEDKEKYTVDLLKHASQIEALAGRTTVIQTQSELTLPKEFDGTDSELVDLLTNDLFDNLTDQGRSFSKLECLSLCTCIFQNFITTFYGEPGSGKTSLTKIVAESLGLDRHKLFTAIQVQRGWTNSQELLGFHNPISGHWEPDRYGFFDLLKTLNTNEELFHELPSIALLDEANLSPIEHYWSDFVGLSDDFYNSPRIAEIPARQGSLDRDFPLRLPPGLRFLATINSDATTEELSERLLSRSAFFKVSHKTTPIALSGESTEKRANFFSARILNKAFKVGSTLESESENEQRLRELFENKVIRFSARNQVQIRRFLSVVEPVCDEWGISVTDALDQALLHLVIPQIRGQGRNYETSLVDFRDIAVSLDLSETAGEVEGIIETGKDMGSTFSGI